MVSIELTWFRKSEPKTVEEWVKNPEWEAWEEANPDRYRRWSQPSTPRPTSPYNIKSGKSHTYKSKTAAHLRSPRSNSTTARSLCGVMSWPADQTEVVEFNPQRRYRGQVCQHCRRVWEELTQG